MHLNLVEIRKFHSNAIIFNEIMFVKWLVLLKVKLAKSTEGIFDKGLNDD